MADVSIQRALLSVFDKTGLAELVEVLIDRGAEIIASGGTAAHIRELGVSVTEVADLTDFGAMLGGRVKTLHPAIHGGILARRHLADDLNQLAAHAHPITTLETVCNDVGLLAGHLAGVELTDLVIGVLGVVILLIDHVELGDLATVTKLANGDGFSAFLGSDFTSCGDCSHDRVLVEVC